MSMNAEPILSRESDVCLLDNLLDSGMINVDFNFGGIPASLDSFDEEVEVLKNSPSHESDSGMSMGSQSPASTFSDDDIIASTPGFEVFDEELVGYLGNRTPSPETTVAVESVIDHDINQNVVSTQTGYSSQNADSVDNVDKRVLRARNKTDIDNVKNCVVEIGPRIQLKKVTPVPAPKVQVIKVVSAKTEKQIDDSDIDNELVEALTERNKKNAVQAKINREKKKAYIKSLEDEISTLKSENDTLKMNQSRMEDSQKVLEEEVRYLKNVLVNQSALSGLLQNITGVKNVELSSSFVHRKRSAEQDHDYPTSQKKAKHGVTDSKTAGVCLHVDNGHASLEFCSHCSNLAHMSDS